MNIVDRLKNSLDYEFNLTYSEHKQLLDYITNLQTIEQHYSQILSENAELRIDISARETICDDYKSRIDKAIEYVNRVCESENNINPYILHAPTLLNILNKGNDKE